MIRRRDFLKGFIGSSITLGFAPAFLNMGNNSQEDLLQESTEPQGLHPSRQRQIFCQFDNPELERAIERCADEIDCEVVYGEPFSPDMIVMLGLVNIIDRNLVDRDLWELQISWYNEPDCDEPYLFIVDGIKDMELPKSKYISQFDLNDPASIQAIISLVKEIRIQNMIKIRLMKISERIRFKRELVLSDWRKLVRGIIL